VLAAIDGGFGIRRALVRRRSSGITVVSRLFISLWIPSIRGSMVLGTSDA